MCFDNNDKSNQTTDVMEGFRGDRNGTITILSTRTLMDVNNNAEKLSDKRAGEFHTTTAKQHYYV